MLYSGSWYEPRALSARIIVLMTLVAAFNLYAAYTANIVALLQSTTNSIKTLDDLYNSPLTLATHDTVYNRYYFKVLIYMIKINLSLIIIIIIIIICM